jgi:hypothetical protein
MLLSLCQQCKFASALDVYQGCPEYLYLGFFSVVIHETRNHVYEQMQASLNSNSILNQISVAFRRQNSVYVAAEEP